MYVCASLCVFVHVCGGDRTLTPLVPSSPQFAFLETIVTAVTDEFPYYLRPKKAVFSGLICVAMYLMGLVLTTDVSGTAGWQGSWRTRLKQQPVVPVARLSAPRATPCSPLGRTQPPQAFKGSWAYDPESWLWSPKDLGSSLAPVLAK